MDPCDSSEDRNPISQGEPIGGDVAAAAQENKDDAFKSNSKEEDHAQNFIFTPLKMCVAMLYRRKETGSQRQ